MRCRISNPKTIRKLRERTGLPVDYALTRGGTGHRVDLHLESDECKNGISSPNWSLFPNGDLFLLDWTGNALETRKV